MARDVRVWRSRYWWRPVGSDFVPVESHPGANQWTVPARGTLSASLGALADESLARSGGDPVATVSNDGHLYLFTREWGARCVRELVGTAPTLESLPPPPLSVVLRPHPVGPAGVDESIRMVRVGIEQGRSDPLVIAFARQEIDRAGLGGARGAPDPDRIAAILFAAVKREVTFVKDPVNGEAMANAAHLLCLDKGGPCIPAGDCDEQLIVFGALLAAVGIPVRLIVRKYPQARQAHITLAYDSNVRLGGPWKCMDPSTDSGACSSAPYTEEIVVDLVSTSDQPFVGLGSPPVALLGQPADNTMAPALPSDQAAGWIAQLQGVQGMLSRAAARLRTNSQALAAVRADLGMAPNDPAPAPEAPGAVGGPLGGYMSSGLWTPAAQDAESKLLQTADFVGQCIADALSGARSMSFQGQDIFIEAKPGDPFSILLAPSPSGGMVPTYFDAQGNSTGTLGFAPILVVALVAAVSLAVAYVVGKVCDQLATAHHDEALNKISAQQAELVKSGAQTPEQARGMVAALTDLNKSEQPKPSALQDFLSTFPIVAIAGAALAGVAAGFGLSRFVTSILPARRSSASAPRRAYLPQGQRTYTIKVSGGRHAGEYPGAATVRETIAIARKEFVPYVGAGESVRVVHFDRDGERVYTDAVVKEGGAHGSAHARAPYSQARAVSWAGTEYIEKRWVGVHNALANAALGRDTREQARCAIQRGHDFIEWMHCQTPPRSARHFVESKLSDIRRLLTKAREQYPQLAARSVAGARREHAYRVRILEPVRRSVHTTNSCAK